MSYLARVRAAAPEPEHTLICAGFTQGLAIALPGAARPRASSGSPSRIRAGRTTA